jgi:hypothetical protein
METTSLEVLQVLPLITAKLYHDDGGQWAAFPAAILLSNFNVASLAVRDTVVSQDTGELVPFSPLSSEAIRTRMSAQLHEDRRNTRNIA